MLRCFTWLGRPNERGEASFLPPCTPGGEGQTDAGVLDGSNRRDDADAADADDALQRRQKGRTKFYGVLPTER